MGLRRGDGIRSATRSAVESLKRCLFHLHLCHGSESSTREPSHTIFVECTTVDGRSEDGEIWEDIVVLVNQGDVGQVAVEARQIWQLCRRPQSYEGLKTNEDIDHVERLSREEI